MKNTKQLIKKSGMELKERRPYDDDGKYEGYFESDDDFFQNNLAATREFFNGGLEKYTQLILKDLNALIDEKIKLYSDSRISTSDFSEKNRLSTGESALEDLKKSINDNFEHKTTKKIKP